MNKYEITVRLDNSYDVVEEIKSDSKHNAIHTCRALVKEKYQPEEIWFINLKIIR